MNKYAVLYSEKIKEYELGHVLTMERYQNFIDLYHEKLGSRKDLAPIHFILNALPIWGLLCTELRRWAKLSVPKLRIFVMAN